MKKLTNYLYYIAMFATALWLAYTKGWILANFDMLKPKEAISIIKNDTNITILDVRTPKEYRSGHIKNSILVPLDSLEENLDKIPKDKKIIVYCRSGNRSINASRVLKKHGYTPIDVKGGIIGLVSNGMKIER